jgi:hypothetical protein
MLYLYTWLTNAGFKTRALLVLTVVWALPALLMAVSANAADKAGVRADVFIGLDRKAKEIYVAGITDALDEAGMLDCPLGTSYSQVITLADTSTRIGCKRRPCGLQRRSCGP